MNQNNKFKNSGKVPRKRKLKRVTGSCSLGLGENMIIALFECEYEELRKGGTCVANSTSPRLFLRNEGYSSST